MLQQRFQLFPLTLPSHSKVPPEPFGSRLNLSSTTARDLERSIAESQLTEMEAQKSDVTWDLHPWLWPLENGNTLSACRSHITQSYQVALCPGDLTPSYHHWRYWSQESAFVVMQRQAFLSNKERVCMCSMHNKIINLFYSMILCMLSHSVVSNYLRPFGL